MTISTTTPYMGEAYKMRRCGYFPCHYLDLLKSSRPRTWYILHFR